MADKEIIDTLVDGGKAAPGPALGPKLSMMKVNIQEVFNKINEKTKEYDGMKVPVKIIIDKKTKEFEISVGTPPVSSLIKKELGLEKAKTAEAEKAEAEAKEKKDAVKAPAPAAPEVKEVKGEVVKTEVPEEAPKENEKVEPSVIGNLTMEQVIKIAKMKQDDLLAKDLKAAVKQVVGTANSMMGIMVENKRPKKIIKEIDEGKFDSFFK